MEVNVHVEKRLIEIVKEAGTQLLFFYQKPLDVSHKKEGGPVSEADVAVERFLIESLKDLVPEAGILAEESGLSGQADYCWVIDPLDGTRNFIHGIAYFCIAVALVRSGEPLLGVVYNPIAQELFFARAGTGSWLQGVRQELAATAYHSVVVALPSRKSAASSMLQKNVLPAHWGVRIHGALALDCAYVAGGRLQGLVAVDPLPWDIKAGQLLVSEAGGVVTFHQKGQRTITLMGTPSIHAQLLQGAKKAGLI